MKLLFNEQDLTNSVCVFTSDRYNENIQDVQAELAYEDEKGIIASAHGSGGRRHYDLSEQDIIDGVAVYLDQYHNFDPNTVSVQLFFDEEKGISAEIEITE